MHGNGNFLEKVGEDSIAATEIDISSEDEPSRRSESLLSLDSGLPVPALPAPASFSSAVCFGQDEDVNSGGRPPRLLHMLKDEEDLPLSMLSADFPSTPRCVATGSDDSSDVVEVLPTTPKKARPRRAPEEKATPEKAPRPKAPSQNLESMASTPKQAPKERTLEAWFSPKGSPKQRRTSPEPRAKAKRRKTLAQSLKDRQKTARTKVVDKEAKAAARAEARKAKVAKTEQLLADTIRSDRNVYEKLLCFELMEIEELADRIRLANDQLRSVGRKRIRDFLEAQGFVVTQQRKIPREVFQKGYR